MQVIFLLLLLEMKKIEHLHSQKNCKQLLLYFRIEYCLMITIPTHKRHKSPPLNTERPFMPNIKLIMSNNSKLILRFKPQLFPVQDKFMNSPTKKTTENCRYDARFKFPPQLVGRSVSKLERDWRLSMPHDIVRRLVNSIIKLAPYPLEQAFFFKLIFN